MVAVAIPSWMWLLVALVAFAMPCWAWSLMAHLRERRFRGEIRSRPDGSQRWCSEFPNEMVTVDRMLTIFCEAFMFSEDQKHKLLPEDDVASIYHKTTGPFCDELQYEELSMGAEKTFGVDLMEGKWGKSFTLGEMVRRVLESREKRWAWDWDVGEKVPR